jgi:hypothetical protein
MIRKLTWRTQELQAEDAYEDLEGAEKWMADLERCDAKIRARSHGHDAR